MTDFSISPNFDPVAFLKNIEAIQASLGGDAAEDDPEANNDWTPFDEVCAADEVDWEEAFASNDNAAGADTSAANDAPALRAVGVWDGIKDKPLNCSVGDGKYSSVRRADSTMGAFLENFGTKAYLHHGRPKDKLPTFAPCTTLHDYTIPDAYLDEATKKWRRPKNLKAANVAAITMLVIDIDNDGDPIQTIEEITAPLDQLGAAYAIATTPSHALAKPRFRVVIMIDAPVVIGSRDDALAYAHAYQHVVGTMLGVRFDKSCTDVNQYYISPALKLPPKPGWQTGDTIAAFKARRAEYNRTAEAQARDEGEFVQFYRTGGALNFSAFVDWAREKRKAKHPEAGAADNGKKKQYSRSARHSSYEPKTKNMTPFFYSCRKMLDIERAYETLSRNDVVGRGGDGGFLRCRCGNDRGEVSGRAHTKGFDAGNTGAFGVKTDYLNGFATKCQTDGCAETFAFGDDGRQDDLMQLDALCQHVWLVEDAEELLKFCRDPDEARKAYDDYRADFQTNEHGKKYANQHNIGVAIRRLGVELSFDLFLDRAFIAGLDGYGPQVNDEAINALRLKIDRECRFMAPKELFFDVVMDIARSNAFHPVLDYLARVEHEWDGVSRLDDFVVKYLGAADTPFNRTAGRKWLIAAARRVRSPGCKFDEIPVFIGPQGGLKSTALATLAVQPEWFSDNVDCGADPKVVIELTRGKWIVELAELAGMSGRDAEKVKAFASRQVDSARAAYGRLTEDVPRAFAMAATSNNEKFLKDRTGNRRFWPINVGGIDLEALKRDLEQLWGEAAAMEARGESIRLPQDLWADAGAVQEAHEVENPYEDALALKLGDAVGRIATQDVYRLVGVASPERAHQGVTESVAKAMRKLGWTKKKVRISGASVNGFEKGDAKAVLRAQFDPDINREWDLVVDGSPFSYAACHGG